MEYATTLKLNKEFKRLYYRGKFKAFPLLVTYAGKGKKNACRIGITTGKKIGGAVARNRARRIIRAAFSRLEKEYDLRGYEFVFVAREQTPASNAPAIYRTMKKQVLSLTGAASAAGRPDSKKS